MNRRPGIFHPFSFLTLLSVAAGPLMNRTPRKKVLTYMTGFLVVLAWICLFSAPAQAVDKYWVGGDSWWDYSSNWSLTPGGPGGAGQPANGDYVYLTQSDDTNRTVRYYNTLYPDAVIGNLTIGAIGAGTIGLTIYYPQNLKSDYEQIGGDGTGWLNQSNGMNTITNDLHLGMGGSGTYTLSGTGILSASNEEIGLRGIGEFTQSGGTNNVTNYLYLGYDSTGRGTYNLSAGTLSADEEYIGIEGTGTFTQSGGWNTITSNLYLGYFFTTNSGTYELSDTGTLSANNEVVGENGIGKLIQTGGSNSIANDLYLGGKSTGKGTYELGGSGLLSANNGYIGYDGTGEFSQTGGKNEISNSLYLGMYSGSSGDYILSSGTLLAGNEYIGRSGTSRFTQTGGTNNILNSLYVGYISTGNNTYALSGNSILSAKNETIGDSGKGTFTQDGGSNKITGTLGLGNLASGIGTYNLNDGYLEAEFAYIGNFGTGTFIQTGGTDNVFKTTYLGANTGSSGTYTHEGGKNIIGWALYLGAGTSAYGYYNLKGGDLSTGSEYVGNYGTGEFTQTGGTNTMYGDLYLGYFSSGIGTYALSGTSSLYAKGETIGDSGKGTFTQDGGSNKITGTFGLGNLASGIGTYNLNDGYLESEFSYIGNFGTGMFTQKGGTDNVLKTTYLGTNAGSVGTYTQEGGKNIIGWDLYLGAGASAYGYYNLKGGELTTGSEYIGNYGTGIFNHNSGTNTASGVFIRKGTYTLSGGDLNAGRVEVLGGGTFTYNGGTFNSRLVNRGTANFNADFTASDGMEHYSDLTVGAGRTLTFNGFGLSNNGTINMTGGTLRGSGPLVNNASISGYGTIARTGGFVNYSLITQGAGNLYLNNTGTNENYGNIDLASGRQFNVGPEAALANYGSLNLNDAYVGGTGTLNNNTGGTIYGRGTIASNFSNSGGFLVVESGATSITKSFSNNGVIQMAGLTASMTGGAIANTRNIEGYGTVWNAVSNAGTIEARGGTLNLGGALTNTTDGLIAVGTGSKLLAMNMPSNAGVVNVTGGTFDTYNNPVANNAQISGYGTFRTGGLTNSGTMTLSGGTTTVTGNVTNLSGGKVTVAYNPAIFTGNVVNNVGGEFKITDTTVTFAGTLTNLGGYISDPATTFAKDIFIGPDGYLVGGAGDKWILSNNFVNESAQNTLWSTGAAYLGFVASGTDTDHDLFIPGIDRGASGAGYANNFAWGELDIASGNSLVLFDGNSDLVGALYVGEILGVKISEDGKSVMNILQGITDGKLNIYYNPSLDNNAYLGGLTYALNGGGNLSPVPIPGSLILFGSGLLGLVGLGRRRLKK